MVVILGVTGTRARSGTLMIDLLVAMAILLIAVLPLAGVYLHEHRMARACYYRAVVMEVVDGEMEALMAGAWKAVPEETSIYPLPVAIRTNLPPGQLEVTRDGDLLRLEWTPEQKRNGGHISRTWRYQ